MATVTRYVNTNSTAGGDGTTNGTSGATRAYASLNEWEAAEQTDLVTDTDVHVVNCDGAGGTDSTDVAIAGWTTGSSNDITIQQNSSGSAYKISFSNQTVRPAEDYITIDGIEIECTGTGHNVEFAFGTFTSADNKVTIKNCAIHGSTTSNTNYQVEASVSNLVLDLYNCAIYSGGRGIDTRNAATATISYCTFYRHADNLGLVCDSEATVKNTYSGKSSGTTEDFWTGGAAPSGSNNCSSDTSASTDYTSSLTSKAASNQFVSITAGSEDFHLKSGSDCEAAGTTVTGITTDFEGDARDGSTPDIGYDEYTSTGVSLTVNDISQSQSLDAASLTQHNVLPPNDISQDQSLDVVSLTQHNALAAIDSSQSQSLDSVVFTQHNVLSLNDLSQSQTLDNVTLTIAGVLAIQDIYISQSLEIVSLTQHGVLTVNDSTQNQTLDVATLLAKYSLAVSDVVQGQSLDVAALTQHNVLLIATISQVQNLDVATLTQHNILVVDDTFQTQTLDQAGVGEGGFIGWLRGSVVIVSGLDGAITVTPALDGALTIN